MRKTAFFFTVFLLSGILNNVLGQYKSIFDEVEYAEAGEGKVRIIQDEAIKNVVDKHQWERSKDRGIPGFRIRIFSDSGPNAKNKFEYAKATFNDVFREVAIHEEFVYPFYKIYVGDFRTRSEALKVLKQIESNFPDAFIVQTKINYPKLKME